MKHKLNPFMGLLQGMNDQIRALTNKVNDEYLKLQDPTRLVFHSPMAEYGAEMAWLSNHEQREAWYEYRKRDLLEILDETTKRYERILLGF